ncbi:hypothetical protein MNV49_003261 [Pseudohyphozyma bogoriensis]|nr:hypothetical protein MNV49_003261 [Pseudohyphozyma bogoriensis]
MAPAPPPAPLLGTSYLLSLSASSPPTQITPSICANLSAFKALLRASRAFDDGIPVRLNRAHALLNTGQASGRAGRSVPTTESECQKFWEELMGRWEERTRVLGFLADLVALSASVHEAGLFGPPYTPLPPWEPTVYIHATFPSGKIVSAGNELTPAEATGTPTLSFSGPGIAAEAGVNSYTIIAVDPDAFSRANPDRAPVRHWVQTGLSVEEGGKVNVAAQPMMDWLQPGPPEKSGLHRYTMLLYRNSLPEGLHPAEMQTTIIANDVEGRRRWNFPKFVEENGLELVGINFFVAKNAVQ